jgi:HEAT repeat protein
MKNHANESGPLTEPTGIWSRPGPPESSLAHTPADGFPPQQTPWTPTSNTTSRVKTIRSTFRQSEPHMLAAGDESEEALLRELEQVQSAGQEVAGWRFLMALTHPSWRVRAAAVDAIASASPPDLELLLKVLEREPHDSVRESVIWTIGKALPTLVARRESALLQELRMALSLALQSDDCWLVREAAAWSLGQLGLKAPLNELERALNDDPDEDVRAAAARALGHCGRRTARSYLLSAYERESAASVRAAILEALDTLEQTLSDEQPWLTLTPKTEAALSQERDRGDPALSQALTTLRGFLKDRRGYAQEPRLLLTRHGPVLLIWCGYQANGRRLEEVLDALPSDLRTRATIAPMEAMLQSQDELLQAVGQKALEACQRRPWQELLILSLAILADKADSEQERDPLPLRVIIIGVSWHQIRRDDGLVLQEIAAAWQNTTQASPLCEQALAELQLWYQEAPAPSRCG